MKTENRNSKSEKPATPAAVLPEKCSRCGDVHRSAPQITQVQAFNGVDQGRPYTHVVWKSSRCLTCGQVRTTRALENRQPEAPAAFPDEAAMLAADAQARAPQPTPPEPESIEQ